MTDVSRCPHCDEPLPVDGPAGVCPACVLRLGLETNAAGFARGKAPEPAELAASFPQFEILELVGQGGMGAVYKARQRSLDRLVALKILPLDARADPAFAERFVREARTLAQLNHPNIVTVYDFGKVGGLFYLVMEYVDGVNLREALREGRSAQPRRSTSFARSATPCSSLTTRASSTATSSRRTSCSTDAAA